MRSRINYASTILSMQPSRTPTDNHRPAFDEAGKLIRVLNAVQPKPSLGSTSRVPTPQQVEQWIEDVETAFGYVQVHDDSTTRTHWALGTVQFVVHRELLQQRVNDKIIVT
jgi:hypothetical protein